MADTSNLSNYLKDVADAIRAKKGTEDAIPAANFDTEIASITTSENLDDVLQEQTEIINELEEILKTKTKSPATSNIFIQEDEPAIKDGIWVKNNNQYANKIAVQKALSETGEYTKLTDIPYDFYGGSAVAIGTDIYLLGSYSTNYTNYNYKYDTLTDEYTKLTDIPYSFSEGGVVAIGTDIYLLGGNGDSDANYKYDTLTDEYTKLTNIPFLFIKSSAVAIGTDIYLLSFHSTKYTNYKYDTLTDEYTKLTDIPYSFYMGSAVAIGTDIYLLGGNVSTTYNYKYDTLTGEYTKLTDIPYSFYEGSAVAIGTDIYLLGGNGDSDANYKYDTLTDEYTKLTDIPYSFYGDGAVAIGNNIYLLGGNSKTTYNYKFSLELKNNIPNNSLVIEQSGILYNTALFDNDFVDKLQYKFTNVWLKNEDGSLDTTTSIYYGDGTQWIKFKN